MIVAARFAVCAPANARTRTPAFRQRHACAHEAHEQSCDNSCPVHRAVRRPIAASAAAATPLAPLAPRLASAGDSPLRRARAPAVAAAMATPPRRSASVVPPGAAAPAVFSFPTLPALSGSPACGGASPSPVRGCGAASSGGAGASPLALARTLSDVTNANSARRARAPTPLDSPASWCDSPRAAAAANLRCAARLLRIAALSARRCGRSQAERRADAAVIFRVQPQPGRQRAVAVEPAERGAHGAARGAGCVARARSRAARRRPHHPRGAQPRAAQPRRGFTRLLVAATALRAAHARHARAAVASVRA
jgi:hypothetical protein